MAKKTQMTIVKDQFVKIPPVATADLTGQTVVVVGANTGLGFEAAKHFSRMSPEKLILACRNEERGNAALSKLRTDTGFKNAELRLVDLSKFSSVIAFSDDLKSEKRLDILVMNAGVGAVVRKVTSDGWEEGIQVNNLSTSLVALLAAPKMEETGRAYGSHPRVVIVSSDLHFLATLDDIVLDSESAFKVLSNDSAKITTRYNDTKLLNVFFARSLASLLSRTPIIVNAVNPAYCKSELRREFSGVTAVMDNFFECVLAHTTEEGSRQLVWAAVAGSNNIDALRGAYVSLSKSVEPSDFVVTDEGGRRQDKLWADLIRELSLVDGRVAEIVRQYSS